MAVLIVDDDPELRDSLRRALEAEGYATVCAADGREALKVLRARDTEISIVLLDLMMPVMNGWQVLEIIGRDRTLQKVPVIVMSAHLSDRLIGNPETILAKPFKISRLLSLVEYHLAEAARPTDDDDPL